MKKKLSEYVDVYKSEMAKGDIQVAYESIVKYMMSLKIYFESNDKQYSYSKIYRGYMDYTYFYFSDDKLKDNNLKFGIVFNHKEIQFELWLMGRNEKYQDKYWELLKDSKWNVKHKERPQYYVLEDIITNSPDFDNLDELSKEIFDTSMKLTKEVLDYLKEV